MIAAGNGRLEVVKILIRYNANLNLKDTEGRSVLHYCCIYNKPDIAKVLFESGADPNIRDKEDKIPIDCCHTYNKPLFEQIFKINSPLSPRSQPKGQSLLSSAGKLSVWNIIKPPFGRCRTCKRTFFSRAELRSHTCNNQ